MKEAKKIINRDGIKYFSKNQITLLRKTAWRASVLALKEGRIQPVRDWAIIDTITSTGLRVAEVADLRISDIRSGSEIPSVFVRDGKGSVSRTVYTPPSLQKHFNQFLKWKRRRSEPTGPDDHIFLSQRGPYSAQGISLVVKKYLRLLRLYEPGKSGHSLRHSYAVSLYSQQKDLRAVQKQLGHASIQTTQIYADVTPESIKQQIRGLYE